MVSAVVAEVNKLTGGAPLVVNLETVLLEEPPERLPDRVLVSHASLAIPILKALNVQAASLANNHSFDVGPLGYRETRSILERAGIKPLAAQRDRRPRPVARRCAEFRRIEQSPGSSACQRQRPRRHYAEKPRGRR